METGDRRETGAHIEVITSPVSYTVSVCLTLSYNFLLVVRSQSSSYSSETHLRETSLSQSPVTIVTCDVNRPRLSIPRDIFGHCS